MRVALLFVIALFGAVAAFGAAVEQTAMADVDNENLSVEEFDSAPFVPQQNEADEVNDDEAEEVTESESADEEDELEGNTEFSGAALLEAAADASPMAPVAIKAQPAKFHPERITAQTTKNEDPEMAKLDLALAAVKEDILSTNKQITDERKWVIAVAKIIASYNDKMKRVESHIIALRKEMKSLYRKKKQIENLKLQKALEAKLKEARDELATLTSSLKHVAVKQGELNKSGSDLRQTIAGIQAQLAKLRGQQLAKPRPAPRKCGKGKRYSKKAKKCVARKARKAAKAPKRK